MNNPQDDRITELYQKIPKARPSEIMDARIRQEARRQVKHGRTIHSYRWLSVAALVVLSVGVVLRIINEVPVEQPLEESVDMMDATPVLKEESRAIIKSDIGFSVQEQKVKKAAKPALGVASEPRMKAQKMTEPSTPLPSVATPSAQVSEADFSTGIQSEFDQETARREMSQMQKEYLPENFCGMEELREIEDPEQWNAVVDKLIFTKQLDQAECLKKLMLERFVKGSK